MTASILVVGDSVLDYCVQGRVSRVCPEGPAPLVDVVQTAYHPGAAGNVAANIVSLGGGACLATVVATDPDSMLLRGALQQAGVSTACEERAGHTTPVKSRVFGDGRLLARYDRGSPRLESGGGLLLSIRAAMVDPVLAITHVVIADYNRGAVPASLYAGIAGHAAERRLPVFVEARPAVALNYRGAQLYKPNLREAIAVLDATGCVHPGLASQDWRTQAEIAARELTKLGFAYVVVTCGEHGAVACSRPPGEALPRDVEFIETAAPAVGDVTGAGDTFLAALVVASAEGKDLATACHFANTAAKLAVQHVGTCRPARFAVDTALRQSQGWTAKLMDEGTAMRWSRQLREAGQTFAIANGCFDCLHAGHIELLREARRHADFVYVAYNDDVSLRELKGATRPIVPDSYRASQLAQLDCVSGVFRFNGDAEGLMRRFRPDVMVKGQDTLAAGPVAGADFVAGYGGLVLFVPHTLPVHSRGLHA